MVQACSRECEHGTRRNFQSHAGLNRHRAFLRRGFRNPTRKRGKQRIAASPSLARRVAMLRINPKLRVDKAPDTKNEVNVMRMIFAMVLLTGALALVTETKAMAGDLTLSNVVELTQGEAVEVRPEIFFNDGMFFLVYLTTDGGNRHKVKVYDDQFSTVLAEYEISAVGSYGVPTDIRGKQLGDKVYLAYEFADQPGGNAYVFMTVRNLDLSFSDVVTSPTPVATGAYWRTGTPYVDEYMNDPTVYVKDDSLFLMTHIPTGVAPTDDTIYRLRQLDPSTLQVIDTKDLSLGDTLDGMSGLSTLFETDSGTYGIFPNVIELGTTHSLRLVSFDENFVHDPSSAVDLVDEGLNLHPTGFLSLNDRYYVSYSRNITTGDPDQGQAEEQRELWLRAFDSDFQLLQEIKLDDIGIHTTLTTDGENVYLAYSSYGRMKVAVFQVPEPASMILLLSGMGIVLLRRE